MTRLIGPGAGTRLFIVYIILGLLPLHSRILIHNLTFCLQDDDRYDQSSDVRTQLKFFEQLDQIEKQRKDEQEREILMRAAKVSEPGHEGAGINVTWP